MTKKEKGFFPIGFIGSEYDKHDLSVTQYFRSEMKLNRVCYFLSYFFSKGSLVCQQQNISYKIDSFILNYWNCQNWCYLLTSAGEISCAGGRERQWQEIAPSTSSPRPINAVEIAYRNEEKQQGATGRTSSPAWNLWKPSTFCPSEENSVRDFTI